MLNIFKMERRYTAFDKKTFSRLVKLIATMTTYSLEYDCKRKLVDYYYDNKENLLTENNLLLRRRVCGNKVELKIKRRYFDPQYYYSDNLRSHEREQEIGINDSFEKHYFFLNNALNSMFTSSLQFDTDKLFKDVFETLRIYIAQENYKLFGYGGLKVEIKQEKLKFENKLTKRKNTSEIIQFKLLSGDETLPLFDDFMTRIERHCKEIFYTKDSKYEIAYRMTKPLPSKEEMKKRQEELVRKRLMEENQEGKK